MQMKTFAFATASARTLAIAALSLVFLPDCAAAQTNAGEIKPEATAPFTLEKVADFNFPWRIAFLPDGRMLITEKPGAVWLVSQTGARTQIANTPQSVMPSQGGMLGVFLSPKYATDHNIYLTYSEPGDGGSSLAMARGRLVIGGTAAEPTASLEGVQVLWHEMPKGRGGQFGAAIAFAPDGQSLFLSVGDRQRMTPAQDPDSELGKILHLTLDGKPAPGNPNAGKTGKPTADLIAPPRNTEVAKTAPVVSTYTYPGPNLAPSEIWATGFRTPYGLTFGPDGRLWELEHGPRGGDELNLVERGKNYGWPLVSYATNYDGTPIPSPDTRDDLTKPVIYWTPIMAPGNITFYKGAMFPEWNGTALIAALAGQSIIQIKFDGKGGATQAARWPVGFRARDIAVAPDGSVWVVEDKNPGGLYKLVKK
jgi:glucose/arabinose dehydrogenase